jgi:hypothetical protein
VPILQLSPIGAVFVHRGDLKIIAIGMRGASFFHDLEKLIYPL